MSKTDLLMAVAVTAELCGRTFSEAAARVFVSDLSSYPQDQVIRALGRCRKEVKGQLTTQDVIARLDDGRPGPEEAWALIPKDEAASIVWTQEMAAAFNVAAPLMSARDKTPARMAFREVYVREVQLARDAGAQVKWTVSEGTDVEQRKRVLIEATAAGRITPEIAYEHCPSLPPPKQLLLGRSGVAPDEKRMSEARAKLIALANSMRISPIRDPKRWAKALRTKSQGGARLTEGQDFAWREAIKHSDGTGVEFGGFAKIDDEVLPPGLRAQLAQERKLKDAA